MLRHVTEFDFITAVLQADRPYLLVFAAHWCPTCRGWMPELEALADRLLDSANVGTVDTDTQRTLADDHNVRYIPQAVLYHKGKLVIRYPAGPVESERLTADIGDLLARLQPPGSPIR